MTITRYFIVCVSILTYFQEYTCIHGQESNTTSSSADSLSNGEYKQIHSSNNSIIHEEMFHNNSRHSNNVSESTTPKIVGGTIAPKGAYPWFTIITDRTGNFWKGCGGMLVAPKYVLTAAHCIQGVTSSQISVMVGAYCFKNNNCGESHEIITVARIIAHKEYDDQTYDSDFALLELSRSSNVSPVVMDQGKYVDNYSLGKRNLYAAGFGTLYYGNETAATQLRHVELAFVPRSICNSAYRGIITNTMMCAADPGQDSCQGDSGGPLFDQDNDVVVGIISWGVGCGEDFPGVYAQISSRFDWIRENICNENGEPISICDFSESPSYSTMPSFTPTSSAIPSVAPSISPAPSNGCSIDSQHDLRIAFTTDYFPAENYWNLTDFNGTLVGAEGPFEEVGTYKSKICFDISTCYIFTLYDTYGDGVFDVGGLEIKLDGVVVANRPDHPFSSARFLLGDGCLSSAPSLSSQPSVAPSVRHSLQPTTSITPTLLPSVIPSLAPTMDCSDDQLDFRITISANHSSIAYKLYQLNDDNEESLLLNKEISAAESIIHHNKICLESPELQCYRFQIGFKSFHLTLPTRQEFNVTANGEVVMTSFSLEESSNRMFGVTCPSSQPSMSPLTTGGQQENSVYRASWNIKLVISFAMISSQLLLLL